MSYDHYLTTTPRLANPPRPAITPTRPDHGPFSVPVPHSWTRERVRLRVVPLVERNAWVSGLVDARNFDSRSWLASARRLDLELVALNVEPEGVSMCLARSWCRGCLLRLSDVAFVQTNVLDADEVLASGDV
jgi:hypothetical protein